MKWYKHNQISRFSTVHRNLLTASLGILSDHTIIVTTLPESKATCPSWAAPNALRPATLSPNLQSMYRMIIHYNGIGWWAKGQEAYRRASGARELDLAKMMYILCKPLICGSCLDIHTEHLFTDDAKLLTTEWPTTSRYPTTFCYGTNAKRP